MPPVRGRRPGPHAAGRTSAARGWPIRASASEANSTRPDGVSNCSVAERSTIVGVRGTHPSHRAQLVEVDGGQCLTQQGVVVVEQRRLGVAHRVGEPSEQLGVRHGLADRVDGGAVPSDPQMTPGEHDVVGLQLGGGRQDDVRIAGGVGEELLVHHREQVVACQATADQLGVGHDDEWIRTPHDQRVDPRARSAAGVRVGEDVAEPAHVQRPRRGSALDLPEIGTDEACRRRSAHRCRSRRSWRCRHRARPRPRSGRAGRRACGRTSHRSRGARRR